MLATEKTQIKKVIALNLIDDGRIGNLYLLKVSNVINFFALSLYKQCFPENDVNLACFRFIVAPIMIPWDAVASLKIINYINAQLYPYIL